MHLDLHILYIQVLSKIVWQVELLQPLNNIIIGWRREKEIQIIKLPEFKKNGFPNHTSNYAQIIPELYLKFPNSESW